MKRFSALAVLGVAAIAAVVLCSSGMAGPAATIKTNETTPTPAFPLSGTGYNFTFYDGSGNEVPFVTTSYKSVLSVSGNGTRC